MQQDRNPLTPDEQIKEAMKLLARAEATLAEEFGGKFRPAVDALQFAVKADRALEQHRRSTRIKVRLTGSDLHG